MVVLQPVIVLLLILISASPALARELIVGPVEADVVRVRDGDSLDVIAHIWPGHDVRVSIRIRGIDAPELRSRCKSEKRQAQAARARLRDLLGVGRVQLNDISGGKYYGRVLASIATISGQDVKKAMLKSGLVRPYKGRKRKSWCAQETVSEGKIE